MRSEHELRQARANAEEHGLEALLLHQFLDGEAFAAHPVGAELHAEFAHASSARQAWSLRRVDRDGARRGLSLQSAAQGVGMMLDR